MILPKYLLMVFALAGDSTMTKFFAILLNSLSKMPRVKAGPLNANASRCARLFYQKFVESAPGPSASVTSFAQNRRRVKPRQDSAFCSPPRQVTGRAVLIYTRSARY